MKPPHETYLPLLGAAKNVSVAYVPVTNEDYAKFTGKPVAAGTEKPSRADRSTPNVPTAAPRRRTRRRTPPRATPT